jgi:hypothetical protein
MMVILADYTVAFNIIVEFGDGERAMKHAHIQNLLNKTFLKLNAQGVLISFIKESLIPIIINPSFSN